MTEIKRSYKGETVYPFTQVGVDIKVTYHPTPQMKAWLKDHPQFDFRCSASTEVEDIHETNQYYFSCPSEEDAVFLRLSLDLHD